MLSRENCSTQGHSRKGDQPPNPYKDFPLSPHATGQWCKKIRGKIHYFGAWGKWVNGKRERLEEDGWQAALALYKAQADDLHAGRTPRVHTDELSLKDLCNRLLTAKKRQMEAGEIAVQTSNEYRATTDLLVGLLGSNRLADDLASDDFESLRSEMAKRWGPVRLTNEVPNVRTLFKYAYEAGLIEKPVRYGPQFKKP